MTYFGRYAGAWFADYFGARERGEQPKSPVAMGGDSFTGKGIVDPWKSPYVGRLHRDDDELLFMLASYLGMT